MRNGHQSTFPPPSPVKWAFSKSPTSVKPTLALAVLEMLDKFDGLMV